MTPTTYLYHKYRKTELTPEEVKNELGYYPAELHRMTEIPIGTVAEYIELPKLPKAEVIQTYNQKLYVVWQKQLDERLDDRHLDFLLGRVA